MKKLLSAVLALCMVLCAVSALAEDAITEITNEPTFEGDYVVLGDTGLAMYVPADFQEVDAPEGALGAMANGEIAMTVAAVNTDMDTMWADAEASVEAGELKGVTEAYINETYFVLVESADGTQNGAYLEYDDGVILVFAFVAAEDTDAITEAELEMLGSLTTVD